MCCRINGGCWSLYPESATPAGMALAVHAWVTTSFFPPAAGLKLLRSVLASVYICSALSRLGPVAHQGMSAAIVDQLLQLLKMNPEIANGSLGEVLCHALNLAELAVGILLLLPAVRLLQFCRRCCCIALCYWRWARWDCGITGVC